jgi:hypothetical protein
VLGGSASELSFDRAAQRLADDPRPDLGTATAARRCAQEETETCNTASVRAVGSIGWSGHTLAGWPMIQS